MHTREQAVDLNNLGVEFFIENRLEEAAIMFDGTIQTLAKTVDMGGSSQEAILRRKEALHLLTAYRSSAPNLPEPKESCAERRSRKDCLVQRLRCQQDPNIRASMFSNAFRVLTPEGEEENESDLSDNELRFISGIAMYNRGLCHHMSACTRCSSDEPEVNESELHLAAMLYNLAYEVSIPLLQSMGHVPAFGRLVMVSLNNLALLLHEAHEYEKSQHYLDLLSNALLDFNEDAADDEFSHQRARFALNTMLLKKPASAPSA